MVFDPLDGESAGKLNDTVRIATQCFVRIPFSQSSDVGRTGSRVQIIQEMVQHLLSDVLLAPGYPNFILRAIYGLLALEIGRR